MEKNTILAVVLSTLVLIVFYVMQGVFFPRQQAVPAPEQTPAVTAEAQSGQVSEIQPSSPQPAGTPQNTETLPLASDVSTLENTEAVELEHVIIETELLEVTLTNAGGNVVSWKLKNHFEGEEDIVDMIFSGVNEAQAFSVAFGGKDAQPVTSLFHVNRVSDYSVEFSADFYNADKKFTLIKRYDFKPHDYMFELTITLDGGYSVPYFDFSGSAYTLTFGPQIGPKFKKLDNRYEYRNFNIFTNGKLKKAKPNEVIDSRPAWAAISGKYFTFITIPYLAQFGITFSDMEEPGLPNAARLKIIRPAVNASRVADTYRFYLGPKSQEELAIYNNGKNEFGLKDTNLVDAASSRGILAPLERALKWLLLLFYKIVPNYGMAIILLTLLIKLLFFPLTKKSSESILKMQALAPKIKEMQDKYKNNPQKLQIEMGNFYRQEGYNPLSGCLPMLLQIPIFLSMYNLFNNHFDLRGAMFIPGWIPDLSVPEYIWSFPEGVRLPLLGWTALRLLPFIYVGSQLLYGKVTQTPGQQSNGQMKMMLYVMPIVFFFILYDVPSGLLIYWIFSNLLTMVQQLIINKYIKGKKANTVVAEETKTVIVPPKKKKR